MKKLIITDLHGKHPEKFINNMIKNSGIEQLICLGDIECPDITEYLLNLDFPKIVVIGNHDYPFMVDCCKILNGERVNRKQRPDYVHNDLEEYWDNVDKWVKTKILSEYAQKIIKDRKNESRFQIEEKSPNGKIVYTHASIIDASNMLSDPEDPSCSRIDPYQLWTRMHNSWSEKYHPVITGTFEAMNEPNQNYWIMFRGHDQEQRVYSLDKKSPILENYQILRNIKGQKVNVMLSPELLHIVSCGVYKKDQYAIFDDKTCELELNSSLSSRSWGE